MHNMLAKYLYGYFFQWKEVTQHHKIMVKTKFKDQLLHLYK